MADDRTPEAFTIVVSDPVAWWLMGDRMWKAAQVLATELRGILSLLPVGEPPVDLKKDPDPPNAFVDLRVDLIWPTALLLGFAAENFVKAAYVKVLAIGKDGRTVDALPKRLKRHDLSAIAGETGIRFSNPERELLRRLTPIVQWAGRYSVPTRASESLNLALLNNQDLQTMALLRTRVLAFVSVRTWIFDSVSSSRSLSRCRL